MIKKERNLRLQIKLLNRIIENQSSQIFNSQKRVAVNDVLLNNENEMKFKNIEKDENVEENDTKKDNVFFIFFAFTLIAFDVRINQINFSQKRIFKISDFEFNSNQN